MAIVFSTLLEEETSTKISFFCEVLGYCVGDCGLACACYTVQPEDSFTASIASPDIYLSKEFHLCALVTPGIVFFVVGIEHSIVNKPQSVENEFFFCIAD
jgi:hypothetical protein